MFDDNKNNDTWNKTLYNEMDSKIPVASDTFSYEEHIWLNKFCFVKTSIIIWVKCLLLFTLVIFNLLNGFRCVDHSLPLA